MSANGPKKVLPQIGVQRIRDMEEIISEYQSDYHFGFGPWTDKGYEKLYGKVLQKALNNNKISQQDITLFWQYYKGEVVEPETPRKNKKHCF